MLKKLIGHRRQIVLRTVCLAFTFTCTGPFSRMFGQAAEVEKGLAKEEQKVVSGWAERFRAWLDSSRHEVKDAPSRRAEEESENAYVNRRESRELDEETESRITACVRQVFLAKPAQKASKAGLLAGIAEGRRPGSTENSILQVASNAFTTEFKNEYSKMANAPDKTIQDLYACSLEKAVRNPLKRAFYGCAVKKVGHPEVVISNCLVEELVGQF